ncbi:DUF1236 domain-containing protein [Phyllobacterium phragmitis]|uniref:DUF1236 domain-containing protein n=1 Tax=Phyllobacterium phragmitis TaxID=2670329 RepID=A0ABQ0H740_9HYPH
MNRTLIVTTAMALGVFSTAASAGEGTVNGAAGGAVTGAIVGGPAGAAVGGVAGAIAGTLLDSPPKKVITYVEEQPAPSEDVVVQQKIVVGEPLPEAVTVTPIPDSPKYAYAVVNHQRVIVDPSTRTVIHLVD